MTLYDFVSLNFCIILYLCRGLSEYRLQAEDALSEHMAVSGLQRSVRNCEPHTALNAYSPKMPKALSGSGCASKCVWAPWSCQRSSWVQQILQHNNFLMGLLSFEFPHLISAFKAWLGSADPGKSDVAPKTWHERPGVVVELKGATKTTTFLINFFYAFLITFLMFSQQRLWLSLIQTFYEERYGTWEAKCRTAFAT